MISYPIYKLIHLLGIFFVLVSLAGVAVYTANGGSKKANTMRKPLAIVHGIGLFLILLGGFGMLARLGITHGIFPGWVWVKIVLWLAFGALIVLASRKPSTAKLVWSIIPFLALLSAYVAVMKPI